MKKISIIFTLALALSFSISSFAQPEPPSGHGSGSNQNGGNAPIGGGLTILLGLGAAYGGKKLYDSRKESLEE